jgi:hypothetical protein
LLFKISHFNLQTITKHTCKCLEKMPQKMIWSVQDNATWQTSSEYCNHMVPSGRTMNYALFAQKIQIPEIFGSYFIEYMYSVSTVEGKFSTR